MRFEVEVLSVEIGDLSIDLNIIFEVFAKFDEAAMEISVVVETLMYIRAAREKKGR